MKRIFNNSVLQWIFLFILWINQQNLYAQIFERSYQVKRENTGYSILESRDKNGYISAGTTFIKNSLDSSDIRLLRVDDLGNVLWDKTINTGNNDYCFHIAHSLQGYVITGMVEVNGINKVFVADLDLNGNILNRRIYLENIINRHSQGLDIVQDKDQSYLVTGFINAGYKPTDQKKSFLMKLNPNLSVQWIRYFDTPSNSNIDFDMGESVTIIPGKGYFVTGSVNIGTNQGIGSGVMAILIDINGNILWNRSFLSQTNHIAINREQGVEAIYDNQSNLIYLCSNNARIQNFEITAINVSTGAIVNQYNMGPFNSRYAALTLLPGKNSKELVVAGLVRGMNFTLPSEGGTSYNDNTPVFLTTINKQTGAVLWNVVYNIPNYGYRDFGKFYKPLSGALPEIFTPHMVVHTDDGGFALNSYRTNKSPNIDLDIIKANALGYHECDVLKIPLNPVKGKRSILKEVKVEKGITPKEFLTKTIPLNPNILACGKPLYHCELKPDFNFNVNGCSVTFSDISSGNAYTTITNWYWSFGDASTSTLQNPSHTYANSGTYNVCLTIVGITPNGEQCKSQICKTISTQCIKHECEIKPKFGFDINGCTVSFIDSSITNTFTTITNWYWTFGDGGISSLQNPSYTYANSGTYNACLIVVGITADGQQCKAEFCRKVTVDCKNTGCEIKPFFKWKSQLCQVQFGDNSTAGGSTTLSNWFWDFGDGSFGSGQFPAHTFSNSGTYIVCLTVSGYSTSGMQCKETFCDTIEVKCTDITQNGINIYPNPTNGKIVIDIKRPNKEQISIDAVKVLDDLGRVSNSIHLYSGYGNELSIPVDLKQYFDAGKILINIKTDSGTESITIILEP